MDRIQVVYKFETGLKPVQGSIADISLMYVCVHVCVCVYSAILSRSGILVAKANVTAIVSGHDLVWVGTKGGHLLSFNPLTADLLLVHRRDQSLSNIVCLSDKQIVTFAKWVIGESADDDNDEDRDVSGLFTVWTNYVNAD